MVPKFRNIIIFVTILLIIFLGYFFFIRGDDTSGTLVSAPSGLPDIIPTNSAGSAPNQANLVPKDFLTLLLNVKNIKLNDMIFVDEVFLSLHDSSIVLVPDGNEGRPNPFAQFGSDPIPPVVPAPLPDSSLPPSTP